MVGGGAGTGVSEVKVKVKGVTQLSQDPLSLGGNQ